MLTHYLIPLFLTRFLNLLSPAKLQVPEEFSIQKLHMDVKRYINNKHAIKRNGKIRNGSIEQSRKFE